VCVAHAFIKPLAPKDACAALQCAGFNSRMMQHKSRPIVAILVQNVWVFFLFSNILHKKLNHVIKSGVLQIFATNLIVTPNGYIKYRKC